MDNWWDTDPTAEPERQGVKHPSTPAAFPFESKHRAAFARDRSEEIKKGELANAPGFDPMGEGEPKSVPTPVVGDNFWESDPVAAAAPDEFWKEDAVEKSGPGWWDTVSAIPGTYVGKLKQAVGGMLQNIAETDWESVYLHERGMSDLAEPENNPSIKVIARKTGKTPYEIASEERQARIDGSLAEWGREIFKEGKKRVEEASPGDLSWESPSEVNFWKAAVLNGGTSLLVAAPVVAAAAVTRSPGVAAAGAAALGEVTFGESYGASREEGIEPGRAGLHAGFDAVVETVMELIPLKFISDAAGGPVLRLITGTVLREVPTEFYTTALQSANAKLSTRPEMTWEEYAKDLLDTVGATLVSAPLMGGMAAGAGKLTPREQPREQPTPEAYDPIALSGGVTSAVQAEGQGAEIPQFSAPEIDFPTPPLESTQLQQLQDQAALIDPETIDDETVEDARKTIVKFTAQEKAKALPGAELAWASLATMPSSGVEDAGELGASKRQMANAGNYVNPNQGDRRDRPVFAAPADPGAIGLSPRQFLPKPGTYGLGEFSDDRPADYLMPLVESIEQWRKDLLPNSTIVVSNEQLTNGSALGSHYTTGPRSHVIVPAVLRKPSKGWGAYNPNTKATAFYNATHEFFHAVVADRFYGELDDAGVARVRDESRQGVVSDEATITLPEQQQAVVREFNAVKDRILQDRMTAAEFVEEWMGPAKIGRKNFLKDLGVAPSAPAKQLVNAIAERSAEQSGIADSDARATAKRQAVEDFLGLEEYLAEQGARFAYKKKWEETSPLGKFFSETLRIMRQFFIDRKKDGTIAPGVAFQEWVEGLGKIPRVMEEGKKLPELKAKMPKEAKAATAPGTFSPSQKKSGFKPSDNLFNTPRIKENRTYAWRSMGASEFAKLANGQMTYSGDKAATKGNFLAGIPDSAAQYGGKGRFLVEFANVSIRGDEGLQPGSTATRDNVSNVWKNDGEGWTELKAPYTIPAVKESKPKTKVKRVEHNVKADTKPARRKKALGLMSTLVRGGVIEGGDPIHAELMGYVQREEWDEFIDIYTSLAGKTVKWELKMDQYYTADSLARGFAEWVKPKIPDATEWIEPSAGEGVMLKYFPVDRAIDLKPKGPGIEQGDFLNTPLGYKPGRVFVGNPPFSIAREFLTKTLQEGDYAAFILPLSFRRADFVKGIPGVVVDEVLLNNKDRFTTAEGERQIRTVAQIWKRGPPQPGSSGRQATPQQLKKIDRTELNQRYSGVNIPEKALHAAALKEIGPVGDKGKLPYLPRIRYEIDVTAEPDWSEGKFSSPNFKAWFGDWERDPQGSSKIRIAAFSQKNGILTLDEEKQTPPLVLFATEARLAQGENVFHASTVRGQHYAESRAPEIPEVGLVPVVLNIRKPFMQGSVYDPAPKREELEAQGHDGIVYANDFDGDLSFIVFKPEQIKTVPDRSPYKGQFHLELDYDQSTAQGHGVAKLFRGLKNFASNPRQLARSFRHAIKVSRWGMQIQQLKQLNPHVRGLLSFHVFGRQGEAYRMSQMHEPDKVLEAWSDLPNKAFEVVEKFLRAQYAAGERWFDLKRTSKMKQGRQVPWWGLEVTQKTLEKAKAHGIDPDTSRGKELLAHIKNVEQTLLDDINEKEAVMQELMVYRFGKNQLALNAAVILLGKKVHELRTLPFLPKAWFGQYQFIVTRPKPDGKGRETIHRQGFDTIYERDKAFEKVHKNKNPEEIVEKKELTDLQNVLMGLPADFLETVAEELDLDPDQVERLQELLIPAKEEKLLRERDLERLAVGGESKDLMRTYASYTWHAANANYKMLYRKKFNLAIDDVRKERDKLGKSNDPQYYKYNNILAAMEGARDSIMHPPNEWHAARTFVTLAYLMGNVKTALVNGSTLALVELRLQAKFGTAEGSKRFTQAVYRTGQGIWNNSSLPTQVKEALQRAKEEGVLTQNYPYHLAGQANASRLWRAFSRRRAVRWLQKDIDLAMKPFRLMEMANRYVTFHAALQEYLDAKQSPKEAYDNAVDQVNALQNDYSQMNRVPFMRAKQGPFGGAAPMATIFMSWPQHAAFHALGGFEYGQRKSGQIPQEKSLFFGYTMRLWALILAVAGYEGLPFAENAINLAGWVWRKFGGTKPLRQELREFVGRFVDNPELIARGLSHNVGGMDLSRSMGWGTMAPGLDVLGRSKEGTLAENVGTFALDLMGVTGAMLEWMWEMAPLDGKSFEEAMMKAPGLGGNMWTSYQWNKHGVRLPNGTRILTDENGNPRDPTNKEIFFKGLGFNPTEISREREIRWAQTDTQQYWLTRQTHLKRAVDKARWQEDAEAEADAREAIAEFNRAIESSPELRPLRISNSDLAKYLQTRAKNRRTQERQRPLNKRFRPLYEDIRGVYDQPDEEGNQ